MSRRGDLRLKYEAPKGTEAARLRQRKDALLRQFHLPEALDTMLPGSLSLSATRCGKPNCHCATGAGHPNWTLSYMLDRKPRVEHIPRGMAEDIRARVEAGRAVQDAVREVLAANVQLLVLARKQRRKAT
jgi:hypothetical protein